MPEERCHSFQVGLTPSEPKKFSFMTRIDGNTATFVILHIESKNRLCARFPLVGLCLIGANCKWVSSVWLICRLTPSEDCIQKYLVAFVL